MSSDILPPITLVFYTDAGHGWLKVEKSLFAKHQVSISDYSYQDKFHYYLEEDCDAPSFTTELERYYRVIVKHEYLSDYPCFIRQLPRSGVRAYL
jgi:hypothetical protein